MEDVDSGESIYTAAKTKPSPTALPVPSTTPDYDFGAAPAAWKRRGILHIITQTQPEGVLVDKALHIDS